MDGENGEFFYFKCENEQQFDKLLNRLHINIYHKNNMKEILNFNEIVADGETETNDNEYSYVSLPTVFHEKLNNANAKTLAWTDSLESEAGEAIDELMGSSLIAVKDELLHETHKFQIFAQNIGKSEPMKERDGLLFSVDHDAAFLISVKARFGEKEKKELLKEVDEGQLDLEKWLFKTKKGALLKLPDIEIYKNLLKGKKIFSNFIGVAVSPLFYPHVSFSNNHNLIALERKIPHTFSNAASSKSK
jgi:hypothetical protein